MRRFRLSLQSSSPCRLLLALCLPAAMIGAPAVQATPRFAPKEQVLLVDTLTPMGLLSLNEFSWPGRVEDAMAAIEKQWAHPHLPPMTSSRDGWQVITHLDGDVVESIELRKRGNEVEGRRIRWKADKHAARKLAEDERWARAVLPRQARLNSPVSHVDGGARVTTFVASLDDSVVNVSGWIEKRLQAQGFSTVVAPTTPADGKGTVSLYGRERQEVMFTVSRDGNQQFIVMHWKH